MLFEEIGRIDSNAGMDDSAMKFFAEVEEEVRQIEESFEQVRESLPADMDALRQQVEESLFRVHETIVARAQDVTDGAFTSKL
jgi:molybdopterin converting factor small subunit